MQYQAWALFVANIFIHGSLHVKLFMRDMNEAWQLTLYILTIIPFFDNQRIYG
jgi:hypothetical protein